jgi:hypothetical protein
VFKALPAAQVTFTAPPTIGRPTAAVPESVDATGASEPPQAPNAKAAAVLMTSKLFFMENSFSLGKID